MKWSLHKREKRKQQVVFTANPEQQKNPTQQSKKTITACTLQDQHILYSTTQHKIESNG